MTPVGGTHATGPVRKDPTLSPQGVGRVPSLVCAAIYLVLGVAMANQLELLSTLITFGALTGS